MGGSQALKPRQEITMYHGAIGAERTRMKFAINAKVVCRVVDVKIIQRRKKIMIEVAGELICSDCGFNGDYHSDEGKCMNASSRAEIRRCKERAVINADDVISEENNDPLD